MGAEQEARPRPRVLSDVKAAASHLERMWTAAATCVREIKKEKETSQSQERFCFCVSEAGASSRHAWRSAKGRASSDVLGVGAAAALFQFRRTGRTGKCDSFSARAATITSMTGSGGRTLFGWSPICSIDTPCTLYNRLIKCNGERHSAQPGENIAKCFLRKSF